MKKLKLDKLDKEEIADIERRLSNADYEGDYKLYKEIEKELDWFNECYEE